ncbi:MAG: MFS transporter [Bifidobacteriaceae bacterium]|jgi:fucose permease|nr:MFS transporter [Bifidobacteriaceae bacterium]
MYSLVLAVIYVAFVSLGLPDSLLGSGWPAMGPELGVPLSWGGIVALIISAGTVLSALNSDRITKRFGPGAVTAWSVAVTAVALAGFSQADHFWQLCVLAVPYGLGAGAVDAALNNYVALRFAARHMNWLHCFWGVGALTSPYIMSYALGTARGWHGGYGIVSLIQVGVALLLFASLPLWRKAPQAEDNSESKQASIGLRAMIDIRGVRAVLMAFLAYCGAETTAALWAATYLVTERDMNPAEAAKFTALLFIGITAGRFICGFFADRIGDRRLIRGGTGTMVGGVVLLALPFGGQWLVLVALALIGLGCAPVYPAIIHQTPAIFGAANSQGVIGLEMAAAYIGSTFLAPLFGLLAGLASMALLPAYLAGLVLILGLAMERLNRQVDRA